MNRFAIANTDSSEEDEIFSKGEMSRELLGKDMNRPMTSQRSENLQQGNSRTVITEKPPTMTHAEWVMENMSRSPGTMFLIGGVSHLCCFSLSRNGCKSS